MHIGIKQKSIINKGSRLCRPTSVLLCSTPLLGLTSLATLVARLRELEAWFVVRVEICTLIILRIADEGIAIIVIIIIILFTFVVLPLFLIPIAVVIVIIVIIIVVIVIAL